jgi:hypothetical protein
MKASRALAHPQLFPFRGRPWALGASAIASVRTAAAASTLHAEPGRTVRPKRSTAFGNTRSGRGFSISRSTENPLTIGSIFGRCYFNFRGCIPEFSPPITALVGDIIRFDLHWTAAGLFTGLLPEFALRFTVPDGATVSPVPLPAGWVMFASALGLAGWLGWRRRTDGVKSIAENRGRTIAELG